MIYITILHQLIAGNEQFGITVGIEAVIYNFISELIIIACLLDANTCKLFILWKCKVCDVLVVYCFLVYRDICKILQRWIFGNNSIGYRFIASKIQQKRSKIA